MADEETLCRVEQRVAQLRGIFERPRVRHVYKDVSVRNEVFGESAVGRQA